jgi:hypothetical protein
MFTHLCLSVWVVLASAPTALSFDTGRSSPHAAVDFQRFNIPFGTPYILRYTRTRTLYVCRCSIFFFDSRLRGFIREVICASKISNRMIERVDFLLLSMRITSRESAWFFCGLTV